MEVYLINVFIIIIYGSLFYLFNIPNRNKVFLCVAFVHLLLIHSLRDPFIYSDTNTYWFVFTQIADNTSFSELFNNPSLLFRFEPGYIIFNYLVSCISKSDYSLFVASSVIIVSGYLYPVYKYSKSPLLSIVIILLYPLIFQQSFYVIRQHMACAIFMFSLPYIEKQNLKLFLIFQTLAVSFHYSAIVMLPLYYLFKLQFIRFRWWYLLALFSAFFIFRFGINYIAQSNERYESFIGEGSNSLVFGIFLIMTILYFCFATDKNKIMLNSNEKIIVVYNFYALAICFSTLGLNIGRLTNYFSYFLCIVVPYLYYKLPKPLNLLFVLIFLLFVLYFNSIAGLKDYKMIINII